MHRDRCLDCLRWARICINNDSYWEDLEMEPPTTTGAERCLWKWIEEAEFYQAEFHGADDDRD